MVTLRVVVTGELKQALSGIHVCWRDIAYGMDIEAYTNVSGVATCNWQMQKYDLYVNSPYYPPYNSNYDSSVIEDLDPYGSPPITDIAVQLLKVAPPPPPPSFNISITKIEVT